MGFVLILLIMFRLGLTHTRLNGLRAANSSLPVGVLSVAPVSLSLSCLCLVHLSRVSGWVRLARREMVWFCFRFSLLFSLCLSPAANLCVRRGSCLLFFLSAVEFLSRPLASPSLSLLCVLALRVSRPIVILICSDLVQLSPPVDFCVRELSPHHFESGVVACLVGICSLACHAH